jgi:hypothetical protein
LPDPDRPIRTRISPSSTSSVQSWTPRTWVVSAWISSRVPPSSAMLQRAARTGAEHDANLVEADDGAHFDGTLQQAVEQDGHDHDDQPSLEAQPGVHLVERADDRDAQTIGPHKRRDHHHAESDSMIVWFSPVMICGSA